jgi:hypothetical protein
MGWFIALPQRRGACAAPSRALQPPLEQHSGEKSSASDLRPKKTSIKKQPPTPSVHDPNFVLFAASVPSFTVPLLIRRSDLETLIGDTAGLITGASRWRHAKAQGGHA